MYGKAWSIIVNGVALRRFFEIASTMLLVGGRLCCMFVVVVAYVTRSFVSLC